MKPKTDATAYFAGKEGEEILDMEAHILQEAAELSLDPQFVDDTESQAVWEKLHAKEDQEEEAKKAAPELKADITAQDEVFVRGLDLLASLGSSVIAGNWDIQKYGAPEPRILALIQASNKAGMGARYAEKFGADTIFWTLALATYAPSVKTAISDRNQSRLKKMGAVKGTEKGHKFKPEIVKEDAGANNK